MRRAHPPIDLPEPERFRISARDHASRRSEFLQDPWLDYEPIRSRPAGP
ncbi:hypothetical protein ACIBJF_36645 [Streptomyces sp. NPDC050743]